jgi:hypothetical protein
MESEIEKQKMFKEFSDDVASKFLTLLQEMPKLSVDLEQNVETTCFVHFSFILFKCKVAV